MFEVNIHHDTGTSAECGQELGHPKALRWLGCGQAVGMTWIIIGAGASGTPRSPQCIGVGL